MVFRFQLIAAVLFFFAYHAGVLAASEEDDAPPNIVLIIADDLGWGDLKCYGSSWIHSPNIDWLAKNGSRFTDYYCVSPKCSPTRASIITGKYPAFRRVHSVISHLPEKNLETGTVDHLTTKGIQMGRLFQRRGYSTGYFGKWHLGNHRQAPRVEEYGWDVSATTISRDYSWRPDKTPNFFQDVDELIADKAIEFVWDHESPFMMVVSFFAPHVPLNPSDEAMAPYSGYSDSRVPHTGGLEIYGGAISNLDAQVGRLLEVLPTNTIVIFTSDNGGVSGNLSPPSEPRVQPGTYHQVGSNGPFRMGKNTCYEGGIRVPLIVYWPEVAVGGKLNSTVMSSVDLLPSLISIVDGEPADHIPFDGEDLSRAFKGEQITRSQPIFFEFRYGRASPTMGMRDGNFKLLANPDGSRKELYDLSTELGLRELNLVNDPARAEAMFGRLMQWRSSLPDSPVDPEAGVSTYELPDYEDGTD